MNRTHSRLLFGTTWLAALFLAAAPITSARADATTEKLIQILVQNGVLRKDQAAVLLQQAQAEAAGETTTKPANAAEPKLKPNTVRVVYIPQVVREQIATEVKQQVMQQAVEEGWAEPNEIPSWTQRVRVSGDVRVRGQANLYDAGNANDFIDFNNINGTSNGYDASGSSGLPPFLNTTQDREFMQLRARLDVSAQVSDWIDTEIRLATGANSSPVSSNQTLGAASGTGAAGDFQKYSIWLDNATISIHPSPTFNLIFGRGPNVYDLSNLMFDREVKFDGISNQTRFKVNDRLGLFINDGAYTLFTADTNYGEPDEMKTPSRNEYLFAAQAGAEYHWDNVETTKLGVGYFSYVNVQAATSALCIAPTAYGSCSTDSSRAPFVQFGNTLMPVRDIAITTTSSTATPQPQFYGLASRFQVLDLHGTYVYSGFSPNDIVFEGEFAKNLAFDRAAMETKVLANNAGPDGTGFSGGDTAYMAKILWGKQNPTNLWDYNVSLAYKYLETDSTVDAFTDALFHLGGTNAKGYIISGNLNVGSNTTLTTSLYSAKQVTGAPYANNVIITDLMTSF
jgi:hypothetical protein